MAINKVFLLKTKSIPDFLTEKRVSELKQAFFGSYLSRTYQDGNENDCYLSYTDEEGNILHEDIGIIHYFNDHYRNYIEAQVLNFIQEFETIRLYESSKTVNRYFLRLHDTIVKLQEERKEFLEKYPDAKKFLERLLDYIEIDLEFSPQEGFFRPRGTIKASRLRIIYKCCERLELIDPEMVSEVDFRNVFFSRETNSKIEFVCSTLRAVWFLYKMSTYFHMKPGKIESSARFITKGKNILTETNYNKTLSMIKKYHQDHIDIQEIDAFFKN